MKKKEPIKKTKKTVSPPLNDSSLLAQKILAYLKSDGYLPQTQANLLKSLKLTAAEQTQAKKVLTNLIREEIVQVEKNKLFCEKPKYDAVIGTLRMHPRGFGFVIPNPTANLEQDVFIPKHLTDNAVDGDTVEIAILPSTRPEKGPEGKILSVVKRSRSHLAGTIRLIDNQGHILAHIPLFGPQKPVQVLPSKDHPVKIGDRVILKVLEWGGQTGATVCEISHIIGHISDPSIDIQAGIEEFNLRSTFLKPVIDHAKSYGKEISDTDLKSRMDLTQVETFTIDPETAKDFDDALSLSKDSKGIYHLMVHIADVAHYVPFGSALDTEAFMRGNSTYFPGKCVPMLPEELSNHLCSLKPDTIRLTMSVLMDFDSAGTLINHQIKRSYIKSIKRFTYEEAKEVLDGKSSPHAPTLKLMEELCYLLKKKRYERGSIDFALPDVVLEVDPHGNPLGFKIVEYDISHQLVEEFMLKANEVVATSLSNQGKPLLYRIHEEPATESLEDFGVLARSLGFALADSSSLKDLQKLFEQAKKTPYIQQLSVAFIRSMKLAYYSPENVGHFGLALENYCHFTSPIRRYPDLIIQRLLFDEQPLDSNLELIALECSEKERISFKAEMSVKVLKKLRLLKKYFEEDPSKIYDAVIVRVKPFGVFFELPSYMLEGFLHISELENDYFIYDQRRNALVGEKTNIRHGVGDPLQVKLLTVDFILMETKWMLMTTTPRKPPTSFKHHNNKRHSRKKRRR